MAPQAAKSFMKDFRASFRKKKSTEPKIDKLKEQEEEELAKLAELKENLGENIPKKYTDADLLGFIRAKSLNVKEAEKLMKLDMNLKKVTFMDALIKGYDASDMCKKHQISDVIGLDKDGCLVRLLRLGECDFKGFVNFFSTIENLKFGMWFLEHDRIRLEQECKKTGRKRTQISFILDLSNLNIGNILHKPVLDSALIGLKLLQDHYHDVPKSIFIVNAPPLFSSAFKVFKPVIQEYLHKKIKIYGYDGYKEELLKQIDADVLPSYLGGNKQSIKCDVSCKPLEWEETEIAPGDPEYYLNVGDEKEIEEVISTTVPSGSSLSFRFPVPEEGSAIHYYIQGRDNDIGVCLYLDKQTEIKEFEKKNEDISKLEQLVPVIRTQCHLCPETGCFVSWFTGTLVFYLDNTYSWMSSKDVMFKITVQSPNEISQPLQHIRKEVMVPVEN